MNAVIFFAAYLIFFGAVQATCGITMTKDLERDAEGNVKDRGFFESLSPLGLGVSASFIAELFCAAKAGGIRENAPAMDLATDMAIFTVAQIVGFVIFFYIIYGFLSLINSHGGDKQTRRIVAGWTNVIVDLVLVLAWT